MKISRNWLENYVKTSLSDEELADKLSATGTSVEAIARGLDEKVVIAEILKIEKHPDADRLQLATVTDGTETITVVCGAPNIAVGQKIPLAKIGAKLPGFEIKKTVIRGVESCGMICAADELALGEDHSGIIVLPDEYEVGKSLASYLGNDTIFEIEVTPNRGDCLSHIGVAHEVAAFSEGTKVAKEPITLSMGGDSVASALSVTVKDAKICPQYMARVIKNVKIGPSPKWLADKIVAMGSKPINNVVDVTNFILFDLGQPLHAFDFNKITKKEIIVRRASDGESIVTLDNIERKLNKNNLVIADAEKPVAIAGVMGGKNSQITNETTSIVIESAEFDRVVIRKSSKVLGLMSDASYRFERGVDSGNLEYALNKAAKLIQEIAGGEILSGIITVGDRPVNKEVVVKYDAINKLLGLNLSESEIRHVLNKLGFKIENNVACVPLWRHDIAVWQDLAEEVGRIYGYDNIKSIPVPKSSPVKKSDYYKKEKIKDVLVDLGFVEVYNYPFLSQADIESAKLKATDLLEVANPIQNENKYLRNSLIPGLLKNVAKNPTFDPVLIFEVGKTFNKQNEMISLALVTSGKNGLKLMTEAADKLTDVLNLKKNAIQITELTREELQRFKIKKPVTFSFEIDLSLILPKLKMNDSDLKLIVSNTKTNYRPISKYPSVTRDLAFIVDKSIDGADIKVAIYNASEKINRVELFDEFVSDKFGKGKKNLAFHLYLEDMERTMTDGEADTIIKKTISLIEEKFSAKLRTE